MRLRTNEPVPSSAIHQQASIQASSDYRYRCFLLHDGDPEVTSPPCCLFSGNPPARFAEPRVVPNAAEVSLLTCAIKCLSPCPAPASAPQEKAVASIAKLGRGTVAASQRCSRASSSPSRPDLPFVRNPREMLCHRTIVRSGMATKEIPELADVLTDELTLPRQ
nr:hypothetical protein CFP56_21147 [Quercus suber]